MPGSSNGNGLGQALISGALGPVAGGAINMGVSLFNHWLSERAAQKQYERQVDFWNMQNNYNHPLAQRNRLLSAGMNPSSTSGEVASGGVAQGLSSVSGNEYALSGVFDLSSLVDSLKAISEIESIATSTDLTSSKISTEFLLQIAESVGIRGQELENLYKDLVNKKYNSLTDSEIYRNIMSGNLASSESESISSKLPYEIKSLEAGYKEKIANANLADARRYTEDAMRELNARLAEAHTDEARSNIARQYAEISLIPYMQKELEERADLHSANAALTGRQREKVYEETLQLVRSRDFNVMIAEATADKAQADAIVAEMDAKVSQIMANNVSGGVNFLDYISSIADSFIYTLATR